MMIAVPRLSNLSSLVTTDERLWLERSGKFYFALVHRDFANTYQKSHPGVTVMWAGLTGYMRVYPKYAEDKTGQNRPIGLNTLKKRDFELPLRILVAGRQAMVLMHVLALILSFIFASRLLGKLPSLLGFSLIAFDPFHIALSRVLHLDGLLADLVLLSVLAFLACLSENNRIALVISSVAAGLAWLTKSPGLFLIPLILVLTLLDIIRLKETWRNAGWRNLILHYAKIFAAWGQSQQ